jgi:SAM-dependent methyltransferase
MATWDAGDFDYDTLGAGYTGVRRPDPQIAAQIHAALGGARTVLNVGAGAGSYEPTDRHVVPVEPSATMRAQRPAHLAPALNAVAGALPFDDDSFHAAMAVLTVHHWPDADAGLRELRRVTSGPVVILTFDGSALEDFWLNDYAPELIAAERRRYPRSSESSTLLAARASWTWSRSRWSAPTGSATRSTAGPNGSSTPLSEPPSQVGDSLTRRRRSVRLSTYGPTSCPESGIGATDISAPSRPTKALFA